MLMLLDLGLHFERIELCRELSFSVRKATIFETYLYYKFFQKTTMTDLSKKSIFNTF